MSGSSHPWWTTSRASRPQLRGRGRRTRSTCTRARTSRARSRSWPAARSWCSSTCRRNITPPLVLRYGATDVPIIQLSLSSNSLPDTAQRPGAEHHPPGARGRARRRGSLSLRRQAARDHGRSRLAGAAGAGPAPADVSDGAAAPERHPAGGRREDRRQGLRADDEQFPGLIESINSFPIKEVDGRTIFMRDVAHVHDGSRCRPTRSSSTAPPAR